MRYRMVFSTFCLFLLSFSFAHAQEDIFGNLEDDIAEMVTNELTRGFAFIPNIKNRTDTLSQGISQADAQNGTIVLSKSGSYAPVDNIAADIEITGTNILFDLKGRALEGAVIVIGKNISIKGGSILPPVPTNADQAATAAIMIRSGSKKVSIKKCYIECTDSILSGTLISLAGRDGIEICGENVDIYQTTVLSGASADTTTEAAAPAGSGIVISGLAKTVCITNCSIRSGSGGNAAVGKGGDAGHGILVKDTSLQVEISDCTIFSTGDGGTGGGGGDGGDGIRVSPGVKRVEAKHCTIKNTGSGKNPSGTDGKAIHDDVPGGSDASTFMSNFAYNIKNTIKFRIGGAGSEQGTLITHPPDNTPISMFANVFFS